MVANDTPDRKANPAPLRDRSLIWKTEGPTDGLTLQGIIPPDLADTHLVTCNSGGALQDVSPEMAELFRGRLTLIIHDADKAGEVGALKWLKALAPVTEVRQIRLPYQIAEKHGKDLRDWINQGGTYEQLLGMAEAAAPAAAAGDKKEDEEEEPGLIKRLGDEICEDETFAQDAGEKLYRYHAGTYQGHARTERFIKRQARAILEDWKETNRWSPKRAHDLIAWILADRDTPEFDEQPPDDLVNVANGLHNLKDKKMLPHSPGYLFPVQLPVHFDPDAGCPAIERFVGEVFPEDAIDLAWEIAGWLLTPFPSIQKAILLYGEGANGKSIFLELLRTFLGGRNVSSVSLHRLESSKFSTPRLIGKLMNCCADLPPDDLAGTSVFKAITGGDYIQGEYKHGRVFEFRPFSKLVFSANHFPRSNDSTYAFFRRWVVIPFERTFEAGTDTPPRPSAELLRELTTPAELSGLLNKAATAWRKLKAKGQFTLPASVLDAAQEFQGMTDCFSVFLDTCTSTESGAEDPFDIPHVTKADFRQAYAKYAMLHGHPTRSQNHITRQLKKLRPYVEQKQTRWGGKAEWCYFGICLTDEKKPETEPGENPEHNWRDP